MKQTLQLLRTAMFVFVALFTQILFAQTEHGNGSKLLKGGRTDYWNINSTTWNPYDSFVQQFTSKNKPLLYETYLFDAVGNKWNVRNSNNYIYDNQGYEILSMDTFYKSAEQFLNRKYITEYSNAYKTKAISRITWNTSTKVWKVYDRYTYNYNPAGQTISTLIEDYLAHRGGFVAQTYYTTTYNASGLKMLDNIELYDTISSSWKTAYRYNYQYNGSNKETYQLVEEYVGAAWANLQKKESSYDANMLLIQEINYNWDKGSNAWVYTSRVNYTYDDKKNLETFASASWNKSTSKWVNYSSHNYGLDFVGLPTTDIKSNWDVANVKWVYEYKNNSTFDNVGYETMRIQQKWDAPTTKFVNYSRQFWWYQDKNTSTIPKINKPTMALKLFPNPAQEILTLKTTFDENIECNICFYNAIGQCIARLNKQLFYQGELKINLKSLNLKKGVYFLNLITPNTQQTATVVFE